MKLSLRPFALAILISQAAALQAEVVLAPLFRDGAVLQRGKSVPVWGNAAAGERISVQFGSQTKETTADDVGIWSVSLDPLSASATPADLVVTGSNTVTVSNVLVGEVWICSGQSNMAWPVKRAKGFPRESAAATVPQIRHFKVPLGAAETPAETAGGEWVECSPSTVGDFSAVGYFFGRELHKALAVPIGLINTSYGGTPIESWMSGDALRSDPVFMPVFDRWNEMVAGYPAQWKLYEERLAQWNADREAAGSAGEKFTRTSPKKPEDPRGRMLPSALFNAMVHPLVPYGIRGFLWYQGENNAPRHDEYAALFAAMITQWRREFGQGELPFYFVQLANLERKRDPTGRQWAFQREAQAAALELPHTGMAVAADIGDADDIHPENKQEVGRRLALIALALTYEKGGAYSGPRFRSASREGGGLRVTFDDAKGLRLLDAAGEDSFELAGADGVFHPAAAKVESDTLVVTSRSVRDPVAVRYAWKNNPTLTITNAGGLPAPPFRSDTWPASDPKAPGGKNP